jgi:solute carrier family 25 (adenine nucleotide translocator) protein 4/5/6/31
METHPIHPIKLNFIEDYILASIAAITWKTISAPIDRVKISISIQDEWIRQKRLQKPFTGLIDCAKWLVRNEGITSLWKSNFHNTIRYFPTQALNFALKGQIQRLDVLKKPHQNEIDSNSFQRLGKNIIVGGLAGSTSLALVYSLDYARTRLAHDIRDKRGQRQFNGIIDVYRQTIKTEGIARFYRGFVITCIGVCFPKFLFFVSSGRQPLHSNTMN